MTTAQRNKCLKVKQELERIWNGELNRFHITPFEAECIARAYNKIVNGETAITSWEAVKNFFSKRKFTVKESGINWIISL